MMTVKLDQADTKCKHSCMTCRACVQLPIYAHGIYDIIDTQIMNTPHGILVRLVALVNGINPDIGTLNKYKGDVSSDYFTEIFKARLLCYFNEVWF